MSDKYVAYAGSYTHESSKGIHIYDMDVEKGRITERKEVQIDNPSYLVLSHSGKFLYSICDRGVAAYKIEADGDLTLINVHTINGMRGCHLTLNKQDTFLIVSGYTMEKLPYYISMKTALSVKLPMKFFIKVSAVLPNAISVRM